MAAAERLSGWWRHAAFAGLAAGLLLSVQVPAPAGWAPCAAAAAVALAVAVRAGGRGAVRMRVVAAGLLALAAVAALAGIGLGSLRIAAIDSGALGGTAGQRTAIVGTVTAPPRRSYGEVRVEVDTPRGRVVLVAPEPVADLTPGEAVAARGTSA